jgi:hypothetical protein
MENKQHEEYFRGLDVILRTYNKAGFVITAIRCDGEYREMMDIVSDELNVEMNYTNAQEHVPEAERNNRTIKERMRATFHRLPYRAIPAVMIRYLAMVSTANLNLFPVKGGISPYYSPRMLIHHKTIDYGKHCVIPFGNYVQATHENNPKNSMRTRTLDAIYLRPTPNRQGGHEVMDLHTG